MKKKIVETKISNVPFADPSNFFKQRAKLHGVLLKNIQENMFQLKLLLKEANDHWGYEDSIYRYYHGSFKVYYIQGLTLKIFKALIAVSPHEDAFDHINKDFEEIFKAGTGKVFEISHNKNWSKHCRPMLEAFFHAKYFLEMAVKYGKELKKAPDCLPSGWAGLLYFYNIR